MTTLSRLSLGYTLILAMTAGVANTAFAQFSWDGDCSIYWHDCCLIGDEYENNWSTAGNPTTCPPLPGPTDTVSLSGLVDSGGAQIAIAGMFQTGVFLCHAQGLAILDGDIFTSGSIFEPSLFQLNGHINLYDGATIDIGSFSTLDFRSGSIGPGGTPGQMLVIGGLGTLTKTAEPAALTRLQLPFENAGLISIAVGTLAFEAGGSSTGTIEALDGATFYVSGGNLAIDGEVRGEGLFHFWNGTTNVTCAPGDYHPINTLIGAVVNFQTDTSVENLTLTNGGMIGGAGELAIDDFIWYPPSSIQPGGIITVLETAQFQASQGQQALKRDMELYGSATLAPNAHISMTQAEIRNYGQFDLIGGSSIQYSGGVPGSNLKNFGTLRKTGGGTSIISVGLSNVDGALSVESGTLVLDGPMASTGVITVNAGATLECRNNQQSIFPDSTLTGAGTVIFNGGTDVVEGAYDVTKTVIYYSTAEFDADVTIETLELVQGTVAGDGEFTVTGEMKFVWGNSTFAGNGITRALGPVKMDLNGYLERVFEIDNAGWIPAPPAAGGTLVIPANSPGELRGIGTLDGNVNDLAGVAPGLPSKDQPIGSLAITGNFTQYSNPPGQLNIDINGAAHDEFNVGGTATLSGHLNVSGTPAGGASYTILTAQNIIGAFAQTNLPPGMTVSYTPTAVILQAAPGPPCPADTVADGIVNVDDLLALLAAWGPCDAKQPCAADIAPPPPASGDGIVNVDDLLALLASWGPCP